MKTLNLLPGAAVRRPDALLSPHHVNQNARPSTGLDLRRSLALAVLGVLLIALTPTALVLAGTTTGGGPLTFGLASIFAGITGPAAGMLAGLMLVGGAIAWGFSERDDGMRKLGQLGLAGGVLVGSATLVGALFGAGI